jgi:hypothetical protein
MTDDEFIRPWSFVVHHIVDTSGDKIMEMIIDFPGGARVDTHFGPYTVKTDQPPMGGGEGSAPAPGSMYWDFASNAGCRRTASESSNATGAIL